MASQPVVILLATCNGARFVAEQVRSLILQEHVPVELVVSDDGSSDDTIEMVRHVAGAQLSAMHEGPKQGFSANFRHLVQICETRFEHYAFCDQDDVWLPGKLAAATAWLATQPAGLPALWCGRTRIVDASGQPVGLSPAFRRRPDFRNAIVQSIAGGNTMVFNKAALLLLRQSLENGVPPSHDWWAYIMTTGAGGNVHYEAKPYVHYREHGENLVGSNSTWKARMSRVQMALSGRFLRWNDHHLALLAHCEHLITADARRIVHRFADIRTNAAFGKMAALWDAGVYRQTNTGNAMMYASCALGRF